MKKPVTEEKKQYELLGLTSEEYDKIIEILAREPNYTELCIFSAMWNEHCSYKSTRLHLKKLHTEEPHVICGPGENAGVIDLGDDDAIIFKMESHNHPSFIEPYQGAATGVGGILRDVFTMGARPIAVADSLFFGEINHPKTPHLMSGVVAGVGGYGNCVGVPNITGDTNFDKSYNGNILVNAMAVGQAKKDKIFYSAASAIGASVMYVGSKTGRDGIGGATMASQEFDAESEAARPTVQIGDPFKEKLLIEACLELMQEDAIIAIQDMGAAGLTSSSLEMAGKGGTGIEIDLDLIPKREANMQAFEIMLSESQERMLMVIDPAKQELAQKIFNKWDLDCELVGKITDTKKLILKQNGEIVADIPVDPLSENAPIYDRPWNEPKLKEKYDSSNEKDSDLVEALEKIISCPDIAGKKDIYEQYDSGVMNSTIKPHSIASGIVKLQNSKKAVAVTTDCTPRYVYANPYTGAKQAVAETYRNLIILGADPLAITNCLNFGNPQKPDIMGQIVKSIEGIRDASKALKYPVISGNVSLYNETNGQAILPTPNIGGVGKVRDPKKLISNSFIGANQDIILIGKTKPELGSSLYLREYKNIEGFDCPEVDLELELKNAKFVSKLIDSDLVSSVNDLSDGGLITGLTKMSFANEIGFEVSKDNNSNLNDAEFFFSETQNRYVVVTNDSSKIIDLAETHNIDVEIIGKTFENKKINFANKSIDLKSIKDKFDKIIKI